MSNLFGILEGENLDNESYEIRDVFNKIVVNAIDFIEKSLSEIETYPKYSAINFCTGIELFFKARLVKEDWKQVFTKPGKAKFENFYSGEFRTIGFSKAIERIMKILSIIMLVRLEELLITLV